ncbi:MerR family transcriptional regulator [Nocardiopsis valliformis]|uniref:MerR family transcriptional regulator n=1 Tax=Nocardiopsis valliformis TaxID=239974 RepID=UPI00034C6A5E|nr:MerR family transcriptional regulator [Nocardiopsis valliformis]
MSLSIKDFSEVSELPPQTLRFYHSEGLLVPAEVDEATGYRYYAIEQVETALLVTALRGTGMSVKLVRRALEAPDTASALLKEHAEALERQREAEDEAVATARELLISWPEVQRKETPGTTVLSKAVPAVAVQRRRGQPDRYDWEEVTAAVSATVGELITLAEGQGAAVAGTAWFSWAGETTEQKEQALTEQGPHWLAKLPIVAGPETLAALAEKVDVQTFEAREELSIQLPGRNSMPKYSTAVSRLVTQAPEGFFPDFSGLRHILHEDGVETAMRLRPLSEAEGLT